MRCLVTAIGSMSAEAVIRGIMRQPGTEVVGCNMYPKEWTAASRLVKHFHLLPSSQDEESYVARLLEVCKNEQISHIIPLTDPEVDVLSANRQRFNEIGVTLCISPQPAIQVARDKLAVYQRFANHPCIHPIPTVDLQDKRHPGFSYPMLSKHRRGRSREKHVLIPDAVTLHFWRTQLAKQDYIVQPHLAGNVFVVDVVRQPDGRRSVAMTRQELVRTANGAGMTVHMQPEHTCDVLALEAAEILDVCGCVNMEFLVVEGFLMLMDVNPRFSAGVAFSVMAGYDMVSNHLRCFDGSQIAPCSPPPSNIYARGFIEYSFRD